MPSSMLKKISGSFIEFSEESNEANSATPIFQM